MKPIFFLVFSLFLISCNIDGINVAEIPEVNIEMMSVSPIKVLSPSSKDVWKIGSEQIISWEQPSNVRRIRIELYRKTALQRILVNETSSKGFYIWQIPDDISVSLNFKIKVINTENENQFGFSERFIIEK